MRKRTLKKKLILTVCWVISDADDDCGTMPIVSGVPILYVRVRVEG